MRLGEKIDQNQFTEYEIYAEMLRRQKDKKRYKKLKKEAKELKKLERLERMKGKKKLRKSKKASASSEDEESLKVSVGLGIYMLKSGFIRVGLLELILVKSCLDTLKNKMIHTVKEKSETGIVPGKERRFIVVNP